MPRSKAKAAKPAETTAAAGLTAEAAPTVAQGPEPAPEPAPKAAKSDGWPEIPGAELPLEVIRTFENGVRVVRDAAGRTYRQYRGR